MRGAQSVAGGRLAPAGKLSHRYELEPPQQGRAARLVLVALRLVTKELNLMRFDEGA